MTSRATILCFLALALSQVGADEPAMPVAFQIPASWSLIQQKDQDGVHLDMYEMKDDRGSNVPSNVLIFRYRLPPGVDMRNADAIIGNRMAKAKAVEVMSIADGSHWKSYIYAEREQNTDMVYLDRIGMDDGYGVEELYSFPLVASNTKDYVVLTLDGESGQDQAAGVFCTRSTVQSIVDQFNAFSATLTIDGKNEFKASAALIEPPANGKYYRRKDGR